MKPRGYTQIPNALLRRPDLPPPQKVLYALLLSRCWGKEWCLASHERLAAEAALSRRAAIFHLGELSRRGFIRTETRGGRRVNRYWIQPLGCKICTSRGAESARHQPRMEED